MGLRLDKLIQQMHNFDDIHIALCTKKGVRDAFLSLYESIKHCMARINKKVEIYNIDLDHLKIKDIRSVLANIHGTIVIGDYWDEIENNENNIEYEFIKYIVKKDIFYLGIGLGHRLLLEHFFTSSNRKKVPLGSQEIFNYNIEEKFIFKNDFLYGTNSEFELPTFDFDSFKNSNSMRFGYSMVSENEIIPNIIKHQNQFGIINRIEMSSRLLNPSQIIHNFLESVHDLVKTMPHYVVYVAGCILDQSKRAWESEERRASVRRGAIQEVIQPLIDLHIDFPGMPCPEDIKFGNPRKLRVRRDYNNKEYRNHCNSLATRVMDEIKKRVNRKKKPGETVLAIIGMENSPSCAVDSCPDIIDGKKENVKEKGIFIEELSKLLEHNNIDIPILGTYSNPSIGETKKRTRKDIHEFLVNCIVDKRK